MPGRGGREEVKPLFRDGIHPYNENRVPSPGTRFFDINKFGGATLPGSARRTAESGCPYMYLPAYLRRLPFLAAFFLAGFAFFFAVFLAAFFLAGFFAAFFLAGLAGFFLAGGFLAPPPLGADGAGLGLGAGGGGTEMGSGSFISPEGVPDSSSSSSSSSKSSSSDSL